MNDEELAKKILDFLRNNENKEIDVIELRKNFSFEELERIIFFYSENYYDIFIRFEGIILKLNNLFTEEEAAILLNIYENDSSRYKILKYLGDEKIISLFSEKKRGIGIDTLISYLSNDSSRLLALNIVKDKYYKYCIIKNFESDALKIKYLRKVNSEFKAYVIRKLKDDNLKRKYINTLTRGKGIIIASLKEEWERNFYLKEYFLILTDEDKEAIITSLKDKKEIVYYLRWCKDKVKAEVALNLMSDEELLDKILNIINNQKYIAKVLQKTKNVIILDKYIPKLKNSKHLFRVFSEKKSDNILLKYIDKLNDKDKVEILEKQDNGETIFQLLKHINDKKILFEFIEHCEIFPSYSDDYEDIIDLYVSKYNINKKHLVIVLKNTSMLMLKYIKNENIIKILNSSEDTFLKIMSILDKDNLEMTSASLNDIVNSLLQREFRLKHSKIIFTFPNILNLIEKGEMPGIVNSLDEIKAYINIEKEIEKNNWSLKKFIDLLLKKDELAINCLREITQKYITEKRNEFTQNNLKNGYKKCTKALGKKEELIKYLINNYPMDFLIDIFERSTRYQNTYTEEELQFINNKDLIREIIAYKRNPEKYAQMPENIKENIKLFNTILSKNVADMGIKFFPKIDIKNFTYEFNEIDVEFLLGIMMNLDVTKLEKFIFNNPELFNRLMKLLNQYKICGWGTNFDSLLLEAGFSLDAETVANFIQYFDVSHKILKEKVEKGEIASITFTALLDLAICYSTESNKYLMVFGDQNFKYISSNSSPNASTMSKEDRLNKSLDYLKTIRTRKILTIPSLDKNFNLNSGKKINIVVGNYSNPINLTYGERTGSCMRLGGAGNSLYDFCLNDKNGFHIRFTNPTNGNFVSRVSGFRNGNTVFLNELRYSKDENYDNMDLVEACKLVANEIIELSRNSNFPIDNVVISPYYAMEESKMNLVDLNIKNPTKGIGNFYIDVSNRSIVLATSNKSGKFVPIKLSSDNLPEYDVQRDKIRILYNNECQMYVAHLKSMDMLLSNHNIEDIECNLDETLVMCIAGEDWVVTIDENKNIDKYIMNSTNNKEQAMLEMHEALEKLKENLNTEYSKAHSL